MSSGQDRIPENDATVLLARMEQGDSVAASELLPLVYDKLRAIAGGHFRGQRAGHTLQPTALVHEAFVKMIGSGGTWKNHTHFCAVAATAMRQVLLNHARDRRAAKRSGDHVTVTIDSLQMPSGSSVLDLVALDDALMRLKELNGRYARIIELRFFGGLTVDEIGELMGVSGRTIKKDWRSARAWMSRELSGEATS